MTEQRNPFEQGTPYGFSKWFYLALGLALCAIWGLVGHQDYIDEQTVACAQEGLRYDSEDDECWPDVQRDTK